MKKFLIYFLITISLAGCATPESFNNDLYRIRGRGIDVAFKIFGYPYSRTEIGDRVIYTWKIVATSGGIPVRRRAYNSTMTDFVTYRSYTPITTYHCSLALAEEKGSIVDHDFRGQAGACRQFANILSDYLEATGSKEKANPFSELFNY